MSPTEASFFVTGGTLPLEAASYLERSADKELLQAVRSGEYCFVLNARQMGKSSLSVRAVVQLTEQGVRTVFVDLQKFGGANVTPEQWYLSLHSEVGRSLGLRREFLTYWQEHASYTLVGRFFGALREVALEQTETPIVIFVDEIDATRSLSFSVDEFFAAMREFYNMRVQDPIHGRIAFCLVGSALPSDLIQDRRTSPFNIGQRIELRDFTAEEIQPLAEGLDRPNTPALLERVHYWTNGHPYLTQSLCAEVADDEAIQTPKDVDRVVERLFFEAQSRERNVNLADVATRMLGSPGEGQSGEEYRAEILDLYGKVLRKQNVVDDEADRRIAVLKLSGVTRTVQGELQVRNRIYERVFDRKWIAEQMPDAETRRQKAAYRRGLLRAASVAAVILAIIGALAGIAVHNGRRAERERQRAEAGEQAAQRQLYVADMQLAARNWEHGTAQAVNHLLMKYVPEGPDQEDRRGFEWYFQWRRLHRGALATFRGFGGPVWCGAFSREESFVTLNADYQLQHWDRDSETSILNQNLPSERNLWWRKWIYGWFKDSRLAFSRDGSMLALALPDGRIQLWDGATGKEQNLLPGHPAGVATLAFSQDSQTLVSFGPFDVTVKSWEVATGKETHSFRVWGIFAYPPEKVH